MVVLVITQSDFSLNYGNKRLSDVTLVIFEEPGPDEQSVGTKRSAPAVSEELPGHGVVLMSASAYCRAALENWASNNSDGKYRLELSVPAGQLQLGKLLVKGMYYSELDVSEFTQQQLLHVLLLADRYEVPKIFAAVSSALQSIPPAELQWDTAMAIYNLPPGCADLEACKNLCSAAAAKVQQQLGDLELVWDDQEDKLKQQQLLDLPHKALKQLLESPLTAVHSENTVCYTIQAWHEHQLQSKQRPSQQEMKQLLELIRMRHCSQLYVATVLCEDPSVKQCFSSHDCALAAWIAGRSWAIVQDCCHAGLKQYPAWSAERRPVSKCQQDFIDWKVPLSQMQQLLNDYLEDATREPMGLAGPTHVWQGRKLQLKMYCSSSDDGQDATVFLKACLAVLDLHGASLCSMNHGVSILSNHGLTDGRLVHDIKHRESYDLFSDAFRGVTYTKCVELGHVNSWPAALQVLRSKNLVHAAIGAGGHSTSSGRSNGSEDFVHVRWRVMDLQ